MSKKISVIVTCFNKEREIARCLLSLLNQTDTNFELIVLDDGSKDNTVNVVKEFFNKNKTNIQIKTIFQENQGSIKTRLKGVKIAEGEFITFIDGDDYVSENYIDVIKKSIIKKGKSDLFLFNNKISYSKKKGFRKEKQLRECDDLPLSELYKWILTGKAAAVWDKVYKKKLFNTDLDSNIFYGEDVWLNIVYLRNVKHITVIDSAIYYHVGYSISSGSNRSFPLTRLDEIDNIYMFIKDEKKMTKNISDMVFNEFTIMYLINTTLIIEHIYNKRALRKAYIKKFNSLQITQQGLKDVKPKTLRHKLYIFMIRRRLFFFFYLKFKIKVMIGLENE